MIRYWKLVRKYLNYANIFCILNQSTLNAKKHDALYWLLRLKKKTPCSARSLTNKLAQSTLWSYDTVLSAAEINKIHLFAVFGRNQFFHSGSAGGTLCNGTGKNLHLLLNLVHHALRIPARAAGGYLVFARKTRIGHPQRQRCLGASNRVRYLWYGDVFDFLSDALWRALACDEVFLEYVEYFPQMYAFCRK